MGNERICRPTACTSSRTSSMRGCTSATTSAAAVSAPRPAIRASSAGVRHDGRGLMSTMTISWSIRFGTSDCMSSCLVMYRPHVAARQAAPAPRPSPCGGFGGTVTGCRPRISQASSHLIRSAYTSYALPRAPSSWACVASIAACVSIRRSNRARVSMGEPDSSTLPSLNTFGKTAVFSK